MSFIESVFISNLDNSVIFELIKLSKMPFVEKYLVHNVLDLISYIMDEISKKFI